MFIDIFFKNFLNFCAVFDLFLIWLTFMPKLWMSGVGTLCANAHYRASLFSSMRHSLYFQPIADKAEISGISVNNVEAYLNYQPRASDFTSSIVESTFLSRIIIACSIVSRRVMVLVCLTVFVSECSLPGLNNLTFCPKKHDKLVDHKGFRLLISSIGA